jgi:hypothetical protein
MRGTGQGTLRRVGCALAALLLLCATLAAAPHGHLRSSSESAPCATCVFAGASGAVAALPHLPPPAPLAPIARPPLVVAAGFAPRPLLALAPKHGPPRA